MPINQSVTLVKGSVPDGTCFENVQDLYNLFINLTSAHVDGDYSLFNYGDSEPSVDDRTKPWVRTISGNFDRIYVYNNGAWSSPHPVPADTAPNPHERRIWVGTESQLKVYDGGSDAGLSETTGPFWAVDPAFAAAFPVGVGSFPSDDNVPVKGTGGSETVTLKESELPNHSHKGKAYYRSAGGSNSNDPSGNADNLYHENSGHTTSTGGTFAAAGVLTEGLSGSSGGGHTNLPPYYGVYFIKRTRRIYYTV